MKMSQKEVMELDMRCAAAHYLGDQLNRLDQASYRAELMEQERSLARIEGYLAAMEHARRLTLYQCDQFRQLVTEAKHPLHLFGKTYWDLKAGYIVGNE